jgi:(p)ppGpp synthase/HD superfamily hydrolase
MELSRTERTEVLAARELSIRAHYTQADRLDGQPYINHPLAVAITLMQTLGVRGPDSVKAALLHDCVEDQAVGVIRLLRGSITGHTEVRYEALRLIQWAFGRRVGEIVDRLTNPDFHELAIQAQLTGDARTVQQLTHHFYKEHVVSLVEKDPDAFLVKIADFYQNAFNLSAVRDPVVRAELGSKYGPVIPELIEKLERLPESGHPLSARRISLIGALRDGYARHFGSGAVKAA